MECTQMLGTESISQSQNRTGTLSSKQSPAKQLQKPNKTYTTDSEKLTSPQNPSQESLRALKDHDRVVKGLLKAAGLWEPSMEPYRNTRFDDDGHQIAVTDGHKKKQVDQYSSTKGYQYPEQQLPTHQADAKLDRIPHGNTIGPYIRESIHQVHLAKRLGVTQAAVSARIRKAKTAIKYLKLADEISKKAVYVACVRVETRFRDYKPYYRDLVYDYIKNPHQTDTASKYGLKQSWTCILLHKHLKGMRACPVKTCLKAALTWGLGALTPPDRYPTYKGERLDDPNTIQRDLHTGTPGFDTLLEKMG